MSAQIIVVVDEKSLMAFDVSDGKVEKIGFSGHDKLACTGASTADRFFSNFVEKDYCENEMDFCYKVLLIDCNADCMVIEGIENLIKNTSGAIKTIKQDHVASKAFRALQADSSLKINKYGMNLNGMHYFSENGILKRKKFMLTGYCLGIEESIKYVKDEI